MCTNMRNDHTLRVRREEGGTAITTLRGSWRSCSPSFGVHPLALARLCLSAVYALRLDPTPSVSSP